jgi:hypothetical protein
MPSTFYPVSTLTTTVLNDLKYINLGGGRIGWLWSDGRNSPPTTQQIFKIVTVSGTAKAANPNLDWNNYKEVEKLIVE